MALGAALGRVLRAGDVVALHGELGAGKTCLVRGIAAGMGLDPSVVSSPTFLIVHEYEPARHRPGAPELVHVDAYRLGGVEDLDSIGWDRVCDGSAVIVIEWAERVAGALPAGERRLDISMETVDRRTRRIVIEGARAWQDRGGWEKVEGSAPPVSPAPGKLPKGWVRCPVSGSPVAPDSPTFPFADQKCRLADLGRWFSGSYVVSRELKEEDLDDPDLQGGGAKS